MPISQDFKISPSVIQMIEDAILFGHTKELDAVLDLVEMDKDFPAELLHGLQSLRYFRAHYGKDGTLEPQESLQKQKAVIMESAWGAELLDKLRREHKIVALRRA